MDFNPTLLRTTLSCPFSIELLLVLFSKSPLFMKGVISSSLSEAFITRHSISIFALNFFNSIPSILFSASFILSIVVPRKSIKKLLSSVFKYTSVLLRFLVKMLENSDKKSSLLSKPKMLMTASRLLIQSLTKQNFVLSFKPLKFSR